MKPTSPRYRQNPHCRWCGILTLAIALHEAKGEEINRVATIDHIKCRGEAKTFEEYYSEENKVLACRKCNHERNVAFEKQMPKNTTFLPRKKHSTIKAIKQGLNPRQNNEGKIIYCVSL